MMEPRRGSLRRSAEGQATSKSGPASSNRAPTVSDLAATSGVSALEGGHHTDAPSPGHRRRKSTMTSELDAQWRNFDGGSPARGVSQGEPSGHKERDAASDEDRSTSDNVEMDDLSDDGAEDDEETGLTRRNKTKRRKRRRRSTAYEQDDTSGVISDSERKEAKWNVIRHSIINVMLILLWYTFSLSISIYNKWMFDPKHLDFHFPLFTTCLHMLMQFGLANIVLWIFPRFRPRHDAISNPYDKQDEQDTEEQAELARKPLMTKTFYITRIGPCGTATGLDIGLGNMSLKYISLTFYTMCKSSALIFILFFAFLFRLESVSWRLIAIILTMTIGVVMMVFGEVAFSVLGLILIISSAFFSGFRWSLTQILLLRNPATSNPFASLFYLAPIMFISLLCIAIPVEGFGAFFDGLGVLIDHRGVILGPILLLIPGVIAFCMTTSEFALLQRTSVVTLSIAGIFKEVVTISAAGVVFHDQLTLINITGLIITIVAIAGYNYIKLTKMSDDAQKAAHARGKGPYNFVGQQSRDSFNDGQSGGSEEAERDPLNDADGGGQESGRATETRSRSLDDARSVDQEALSPLGRSRNASPTSREGSRLPGHNV